MHIKTQTALDELRFVEWFRNVGHRDADDVEFVSSWSEAIAYSESPESDNVLVESLNILGVRVRKYSVDLYDAWNDLVLEIKPVIEPLVELKTRDVLDKENLPEGFLHSVRWDILAICLELEYSAVVPIDPRLHRLRWYLGGHFPCGWRGAFPEEGKLIVF